jgi:hypothetical protein
MVTEVQVAIPLVPAPSMLPLSSNVTSTVGGSVESADFFRHRTKTP